MPPEHDGKKREQEADRQRSTSPSPTPTEDEIDLKEASQAAERTIENQALGRSRGKPSRRKLRSRRISAIIPTKTNERAARKKRGSDGGRPYQFDKEQYRLRNLVERCINKLKQNRRIATRYDKRAENYQAFITIASILLWLRSLLSDTALGSRQ